MTSHITNSTRRTRALASVAILAIIAASTAAQAAPVTDWRTYKATNATTLTGQGTSAPVIGDLLGNAASPSFVIGYLTTPAVLGANVGDQIEFTFGVSFNDAGATGMSNNGDNFRFALFDLNGEGQDSATGGPAGDANYASAGTGNTDNFRGYIFGHRGGGGAGAGGSMRERIAPLASGQNAFAATGDNNPSAPSMASVTGDSFPMISQINGAGEAPNYAGLIKLVRTAEGIDVSGTFSDGTETNIFQASDNAEPSSSTFGAVGFLLGNGLSVDEVRFTDVDVTVTPAGGADNADFDGDGDVDGQDFLTWQRGLGGPGTDPVDGNADGDTDVDADDLAVWKAQFGAPAAAASVGVVPEPALATLLAAAGVAALLYRRAWPAIIG